MMEGTGISFYGAKVSHTVNCYRINIQVRPSLDTGIREFTSAFVLPSLMLLSIIQKSQFNCFQPSIIPCAFKSNVKLINIKLNSMSSTIQENTSSNSLKKYIINLHKWYIFCQKNIVHSLS